MFDLGFGEIILILIVSLLVLGPEKLPRFARLLGSGFAKFRSLKESLQSDFKEQLIDSNLGKIGDSIKKTVNEIKEEVEDSYQQIEKGMNPDFLTFENNFQSSNPKEYHLPYSARSQRTTIKVKNMRIQRNKIKNKQRTVKKHLKHPY